MSLLTIHLDHLTVVVSGAVRVEPGRSVWAGLGAVLGRGYCQWCWVVYVVDELGVKTGLGAGLADSVQNQWVR